MLQELRFRRVWVGKSHGITIGSETSGGIRNVSFEDIRMEHSKTGIRLKSRAAGGVFRGSLHTSPVEEGDVQARQPNSPRTNCNDEETDTLSLYQMSL